MGDVLTVDDSIDARACRCKAAALRAYDELHARDELDIALDAATRVYRHHNPNIPEGPARETIQGWLAAREGRRGA